MNLRLFPLCSVLLLSQAGFASVPVGRFVGHLPRSAVPCELKVKTYMKLDPDFGASFRHWAFQMRAGKLDTLLDIKGVPSQQVGSVKVAEITNWRYSPTLRHSTANETSIEIKLNSNGDPLWFEGRVGKIESYFFNRNVMFSGVKGKCVDLRHAGH